MSWNSFQEGILEHHNAISKYFNTGIGKALQREEANIAEAVFLRFVSMSQPCLPVHDSFITYATLADEVADITARAALGIDGVELPVGLKHLTVLSGSDGSVTDDISDILGRMASGKGSQ